MIGFASIRAAGWCTTLYSKNHYSPELVGYSCDASTGADLESSFLFLPFRFELEPSASHFVECAYLCAEYYFTLDGGAFITGSEPFVRYSHAISGTDWRLRVALPPTVVEFSPRDTITYFPDQLRIEYTDDIWFSTDSNPTLYIHEVVEGESEPDLVMTVRIDP